MFFTTIKIFNTVWDVEFVKEDDARLDEACGLTDKFKNKIYINDSLRNDMKRRTIMHELTHAYIWTYGLENFVIRKFTEEDICNFVETYGEEIINDRDKIYTEYLAWLNKED